MKSEFIDPRIYRTSVRRSGAPGPGDSSFGAYTEFRPEWIQAQLNTPENLRLRDAYLSELRSEAQREATGRTGQDRAASQIPALTGPQKGMVLGDAIPVVFARRRTGGSGGVLVAPLATEARFSNTNTAITASYHCVLGLGQMGSIQRRDVRNGMIRPENITFSQNYGVRAGSWLPGNFSVPTTDGKVPTFPKNTGGGGNYNGISTIEFTRSYPIESENWKNKWSVFVREGMYIQRGRIYDSVVGPSDNIVDLAIFANLESGLVKEAEIDFTQCLAAATFIEYNELYCNAEFSTLTSIPDFLTNALPGFLLREARSPGGRFALTPLVPVNSDGSINGDPLVPDWIITEDSIAPGSWQERPAPAASRQPLRINVLFRQQTSELEPPLRRDLPVGVAGNDQATVEEWDLSGSCTHARHAWMAGAYRLAQRTLAAGSATVSLLPGRHSATIRAGQLIHAFFRIRNELEQIGQISGYWWIDEITTEPSGLLSLELRACPVDGEGRSLVALAVLAAKNGILPPDLPYPPLGNEDAPGTRTDLSVPPPSTNGRPPFSEGSPGGGGGGTGGTLPPLGPPIDAPAPPAGPGGGNVIEAGGDPSGPDDPIGGAGEVVSGSGPSCPWGDGISTFRIYGIQFGAGGLSFSYLGNGSGIVVSTIGMIISKMTESGYNSTWNANIEKWHVEYLDDTQNRVTMTVHSSTDAPSFDSRGEFRIEPQAIYCLNRNGT